MTTSQQTLNVSLSATDPNGLPLTYSATGQSLAYVLTQQTGTLTYHSEWDNWGGRSEKWLLNPSNQWYFVLPSGELDRWDGSGTASGTSLGNVGTSYYTDPTRLTNPPANQPRASFGFSGNTLTITRDPAWASGMVITATASNGQASDSKTFTVTVTVTGNLALVLSPVADRTIPSSQQTLNVPLSVTNPNGNPLTFSATGQSLAYVLTQQTGTLTYYSVWDNWGGRGEKWLLNPSNQWYFVLPTGELDRWDGGAGASGTSLGNVGTSYYTDPTRLTNPPANQPRASFSFSGVTTTGATLTVTRDTAWASSMVITVGVTDGTLSDSKTFNVFVT